MYGNLTQEQLNLQQLLKERGRMDSLAHIVKGVELDWFQTYALMHNIITKGSIISLDTGLGKTLVAIGYINYRHAVAPSNKTIYICERSNFEATLAKICRHSSVRVIGTTAENHVMWSQFLSKYPTEYDVIVLTYQAMNDKHVNDYLFDNKHLFQTLIIDESHKVSNRTSLINNIVRGMSKYVEHKMFLTATPLRISPRQIINQIDMIDRTYFEDVERYSRSFEIHDEMGGVIGHKNLDNLAANIIPRYVGYTREELGLKGQYKLQLILANPSEHHLDVTRADINPVIKGDKDGDALTQTLKTIQQLTQEGKKGLVYANTNQNKQMLIDSLTQEDISCALIDGSNRDRRTLTQNRFNNDELQVVVTNITTALDLQCDFVLFYELTVDHKQMIGRGERGLKGNDLTIIYVIVKDTVEVDYFIENVYNRGVLLKEIARKDNTELEYIKTQLPERED